MSIKETSSESDKINQEPEQKISLLDIESTRNLFINAKFKPFASLGFEYDKDHASSSVGFGSTVYLHNTATDRMLTVTNSSSKPQKNKLNIVSNEPCPICFEDIDHNDEFITGCSHRFHSPCINKWLENNNNCPMCRKSIKFAKNLNFAEIREQLNNRAERINDHIDYEVNEDEVNDYEVNDYEVNEDDNNLINEVD